jgi:hypothetical protein
METAADVSQSAGREANGTAEESRKELGGRPKVRRRVGGRKMIESVYFFSRNAMAKTTALRTAWISTGVLLFYFV